MLDKDIILYIQGKASIQLIRDVDNWLMESEENRKIYNKIKKILDAIHAMKDLRVMDPLDAWKKFEKDL